MQQRAAWASVLTTCRVRLAFAACAMLLSEDSVFISIAPATAKLMGGHQMPGLLAAGETLNPHPEAGGARAERRRR